MSISSLDIFPLIVVVALVAIFIKITNKVIKLILTIAVIVVVVCWAIPKFVLGY